MSLASYLVVGLRIARNTLISGLFGAVVGELFSFSLFMSHLCRDIDSRCVVCWTGCRPSAVDATCDSSFLRAHDHVPYVLFWMGRSGGCGYRDLQFSFCGESVVNSCFTNAFVSQVLVQFPYPPIADLGELSFWCVAF